MSGDRLAFRFYRGVGFMMLGDSDFAKSYRKNRPDIWKKVCRRLGINPNIKAMRQKPIKESEIVSNLPPITIGGTLEMKRGKLCLRRGDEVRRLASGKYKVTRCWIPPGKTPWNTELYAVGHKTPTPDEKG